MKGKITRLIGLTARFWNEYRIISIVSIVGVVMFLAVSAMSGVLAWQFSKPDVPVWTTVTKTLNPASDPGDPKWMTTVTKEPSPTGRKGNTLKFTIPAGTNVEGIDLSKISVKKGASPQTEIVSVKGGSTSYLKICDLDVTNYHGTEFEMTNSKVRKARFEGTIEVEGESINVSKTEVSTFACGNPEWGELPADSFKGRVSQVVIESTGTGDPKLGYLKLSDFRVPGRTVFDKLKVQDLSFTDVTFGDGDRDFSAQDFVINANNEIRQLQLVNLKEVKGDAAIDNR